MLLVLLLAGLAPPFDFAVTPAGGLTVTVGGVPVVRGSWFQVYDPGYTKGHFTSSGGGQRVERIGPDEVRTTFETAQVRGGSTYRRVGNTLAVESRFEWLGEGTVHVESTAGMPWSPAFETGSVTADGRAAKSLVANPRADASLEARRLVPDSSAFVFDGPAARVEVSANRPLTLFDARGYPQPWAERKRLWWLGGIDMELSKGKPIDLRVEWKIVPKTIVAPSPRSIAAKLRPIADAVRPDESKPVLIPKPKTAQLRFDRPTEWTGNTTFPAGRFGGWPVFGEALSLRFDVPKPVPNAPTVAVDGGEARLGLRPGGYRIVIEPRRVSVVGEDAEGLRNGLRRLAHLAFVQGGKLMLPTGIVVDEPAVGWRGVHLFVGPKAPAFQDRLWRRVLLPMFFNQVVLQCEQTDWKAAPGIATPNTMSRSDLAGLFATYRRWGIEPIPLIQSWGHMEWLFANGKNVGLAHNPEVRYAIDPNKPEARRQVEAIWEEAVALLKPKVAHFGLDEVDMRGYDGNPEPVTAAWESYLPWLGDLAKRLGVQPMLWGDNMLAPGEAADATSAPTVAHAARRRAALPKGTWVADWHYKAAAEPEPFLKSLDLWKREGHRPIASTWYPPRNVRGFVRAADLAGAGTLQTTWAGYSSDEASMVANLDQFAAMVLAADYAWSGRKEMPEDLPYRAAEVFRRLYFGGPSPVRPGPGHAVEWASSARAGVFGRTGVGLATAPVELFGMLREGGRSSAAEVRIPVGTYADEVMVALAAAVFADDGDRAGEIEVRMAGGKVVRRGLTYGVNVRSVEDLGPLTEAERDGSVGAVSIPAGGVVESIVVRSAPAVGLRLFGATTTGVRPSSSSRSRGR